MPKPPRRAVFPVLNGSQENPIRGSNVCSVGFEKYGSPVCNVDSVKLCRDAILPCFSVGTVDISYRNPKLTVRLGNSRRPAARYAPKIVWRIFRGTPVSPRLAAKLVGMFCKKLDRESKV